MSYLFRFVSVFLCCVVLSGVGFAQGNDSDFQIRVIQKDGTEAVIDIRDSYQPPQKIPAPASEKIVEPVEPEAPSSAVDDVPRLVDAPVSKSGNQDVAGDVRRDEPARSVSEKASKGAALSASRQVRMIVPPRKPYQIDETNTEIIGSDRALAIAINYAPPTRNYKVFEDFYAGKPAYKVAFITPETLHFIFVDPFSGRVLDAQDYERAQEAKPGHLPVR